jgi:hypothetical protein
MMLFTRRSKRALSWVLLLAWLFGLSAGVANACVLEARNAHDHPAAASDSGANAHSTVGAGHRVVIDQDTGHAARGGAEASCLKVCDEVPQSPTQSTTSVDTERPVVQAAWWSPLPVFDDAAVHPATPAHTLPPGPPPRVWFSRLAL